MDQDRPSGAPRQELLRKRAAAAARFLADRHPGSLALACARCGATTSYGAAGAQLDTARVVDWRRTHACGEAEIYEAGARLPWAGRSYHPSARGSDAQGAHLCSACGRWCGGGQTPCGELPEAQGCACPYRIDSWPNGASPCRGCRAVGAWADARGINLCPTCEERGRRPSEFEPLPDDSYCPAGEHARGEPCLHRALVEVLHEAGRTSTGQPGGSSGGAASRQDIDSKEARE